MHTKITKAEAAAAALLLLAGLVCALLQGMFPAPDKWMSDLLCQRAGVTEKKIYLIAIDDKTLKEYGAVASWSRSVPARLVELLNSGGSAPAVIGFDLLYSEDGEGDEAFARACREAGNVVTAMDFHFKEMPETDESGRVSYHPFHVDYAVMPFGGLSRSAEVGFANTLLDSDGYVRRAILKVGYKGETYYSLAARIYKQYQESRGERAALPGTDENGVFYFSYSGAGGCYSTVSMADVLDGTVDPRLFSDAVVLVGAYAEGMQDAYRPSISRNRQMFGVEIQANILEALLEGKTQVAFPLLPYALCVGALSAAFFLTIRRLKILRATAALAAAVAADLVFVKAMYAAGYVTQALTPIVMVTGIYAGNLIHSYILEVLKRKRLVGVFKQYVTPQVVDQIAKKKDFELRLGGETRRIAVLFVDIRGFTSMSEKLKPEVVVEILNQYLALTTSAILKNGGMLDKFIGDAAMAVFNAPVDLDDYLYRAVCAAADMRAGAAEMEKSCKERFGRSVAFGIGIHCGEAVVGNIGCEFRMDYTAVGDTVNTAARLEENAGKGQILISGEVYEALKERIEAEPVGEIALKGKEKGVFVYQLNQVG